MSDMSKQQPNHLAMTAETIGRDLLQAMLTELKLLPKPWPALSQKSQDEIINRLRASIEHNVATAVHLIASQGRTVVVGDLEQIVIKDGVKAAVKFSPSAANLHSLYDAAGKAVLVVVAAAADHTGGMEEIKGESDQRGLDLGNEYHDNDGGGMDGNGDEVIEGEVLGLPSPDQVNPTDEEMEKAWDDGYQAASEGKQDSACPIIRAELVAEWMRGWKAWHEEQQKAA